jgi:hypothetical protein
MNESVTLRPRFGKVLSIAVWLIAAISIVTLVATLDPGRILHFAWGLLLLAFGAWLLFWRPAVIIEPFGVSFVNLLRTRRISWPAIQRIDTKYALTLYTPAGSFSAWAAPAPGRGSLNKASRQDLRGLPESTYGSGGSVAVGDVPTSDSGAASLVVRRHWEELRDAGHLDSGVVEGTGVTTTWHVYSAAVLGVLVVATILGATL